MYYNRSRRSITFGTDRQGWKVAKRFNTLNGLYQDVYGEEI